MTTLIQAASQPTVNDPHTLVFGIAAVLCLLVPVVIVGAKRDLGWQRKVYWGSTFGAVVCVMVASLPNFATGVLLAGFAVFLMVIRAYFATQYIKVGGRVIAFDSPVSQRRGDTSEDEPYSPTVSAAKMWWLLVFGVGGVGASNMWLYTLDRTDLRYGLLGLAIVAVTGLLYGGIDGAGQQRVARGRYVPFAILSIVTAGIFAVSYLATHTISVALANRSR